MCLSDGREAEHSGAGPPLPVADFIIDTTHGASGGGDCCFFFFFSGELIKACVAPNTIPPIPVDYEHEYCHFFVKKGKS